MNEALPEEAPESERKIEMPIAALGAIHATLSFLAQVIAFLAFFAFLFFWWPPTWFKTSVEQHYKLQHYQLCVEHSYSTRACEEP